MAKMKVHELAKEVDRKSKDLIEFLKAEGYDVKVAQSSIEDAEIALVRKKFGGSGQGNTVAGESAAENAAKTGDTPKKAETAQQEKPAAKSGTGQQEKPAAKAETGQQEKSAAKTDAPKKKRIIFVSNPHNSKMGGRPSQGQNAGGGQNRGNGGRQMSNGARPVQPQNTPHKIVRPTQKPIPVTAEPYDVRQKQKQERRLEQRQQEKRQEQRQQEQRQQERRDTACWARIRHGGCLEVQE